EFPPDVRQAQAVAVEGDAADNARQHPASVSRISGAEAQRVHHAHRSCAHRQDVADDAADTGRRALERLDVRGVIVGLNLECDRVALTDVDDASVLPYPGEQHVRGWRGVGELPQVLARGFV